MTTSLRRTGIPPCLLLVLALAAAGAADAKTIVLDGDMSDWTASDIFYEDDDIVDGLPLSSTCSNIYVCNSSTCLYVGLQLKAPSSIMSNWVCNLYIDTDMNPNTGFKGSGNWMSNGYDRLVQYGAAGMAYGVHAYTGTAHEAWDWGFLGYLDYSYNENIIEWSIPRAWLGMAGNQEAVLEFHVTEGDAMTNAGGIETWAWHTETGALVYTFSPPFNDIGLDGNLAEWEPDTIFYQDGEIGDGLPANSSYSNIFVVDSESYLYIGLQTKDAGGSPISNPWMRSLLIDKDKNAATGYRGYGNWMAHGYDILVEYGAGSTAAGISDFAGATQGDWQWTNDTALTWSYSDNAIEWAIPRSRFGHVDGVYLEFWVHGNDVTEETWAHASEAGAKEYRFFVTGYIPTLTQWGFMLLAAALLVSAWRMLAREAPVPV